MKKRIRIAPWKIERRTVLIVVAKLRDEWDERYMHLCTQCLEKRKRKAEKETHWNRSRFHHYQPPEYYHRPGIGDGPWWLSHQDTTNLECEDCGWTANGKGIR